MLETSHLASTQLSRLAIALRVSFHQVLRVLSVHSILVSKMGLALGRPCKVPETDLVLCMPAFAAGAGDAQCWRSSIWRPTG